MPAFLNPAMAEFWVGAGLVIFLGIVIFGAKAPKAIAAALDAKTASVQADSATRPDTPSTPRSFSSTAAASSRLAKPLIRTSCSGEPRPALALTSAG